MKYYRDGLNFHPMPDDADVLDSLPGGYYRPVFEKMTGWRICMTGGIQDVVPLFGPMAGKVDKVIKAFERRQGNTGVLLSGEKGLGKSLFLRHVAARLVSEGMPVIMVTQNIPGIVDFLGQITQPVVILLDEFDKNFIDRSRDSDSDNPKDEQNKFLLILDGVLGVKRLILATCNELNSVSSYFINRPGRFHYHFRFECPDGKTAVEYMRWLGTDPSVDLSKLEHLCDIREINYDCLRAVAEELANGESMEDTLNDLNIDFDECGLCTLVANVVTKKGVHYTCQVDWNDMQLDDDDPYIEVHLADARTKDAPPKLWTRVTRDVIHPTGKLGVYKVDVKEMMSDRNESATQIKEFTITIRKAHRRVMFPVLTQDLV